MAGFWVVIFFKYWATIKQIGLFAEICVLHSHKWERSEEINVGEGQADTEQACYPLALIPGSKRLNAWANFTTFHALPWLRITIRC